MRIEQGCGCCETPTAEVNEQAKLQVAPTCLGCRLGIDDCNCNWITKSWITESGMGSLPAADDAKGSGSTNQDAHGTRSGETRIESQHDAHAIVWLMIRAIVATTVFAPTIQDITPVDEGRKSAAARLKEKLESMVKIRRGLTVDSGAADHVMPLSWLTWIVMTMSLGALRGLHYVSASGGRLPNLGERKVDFLTEEGTWGSIVCQIAGINKPLLSVSKLINDGWRVVFDEDECFMLHKDSKKQIAIKREGGVFVVDAYVNGPEPGFTRQA